MRAKKILYSFLLILFKTNFLQCVFSVFDVDFDVFSTFLIYRSYNQYFAEEKIKTLTPNLPVYIIKRMYRYKLIMDQGRDL